MSGQDYSVSIDDPFPDSFPITQNAPWATYTFNGQTVPFDELTKTFDPMAFLAECIVCEADADPYILCAACRELILDMRRAHFQKVFDEMAE